MRFDNTQACREGWAIFNEDDEGRGEIQRLDEEAVFPDDEAAVEHVRARAAAGSKLHQTALAMHERFVAVEEGGEGLAP